jgi:FtsP/CotA-like multicopper oxidase with cupredoxin domain
MLRTTLSLSILCALAGCSTPNNNGADAQPNNDASADLADVNEPLAPLPAVEGLTPLVDHNPDPNVVEVDLEARSSEVEFRPGVPTRVLSYEGTVPGPLLHARVGDRVIVHFRNSLTAPTIVHWHGLRISDQMDGSPRLMHAIEPMQSFRYEFVVPDAGTFWYHAHVDATHQIERGLYGAIVVHERRPPTFDRERIFVLDDVRLESDGQISPFNTSGPDIGRGRTGNALLVNGRTRPIEGTLARNGFERWRVVNSANARTMYVRVQGGSALVIGTDGGLIANPYELNEIEVAPGQRYDLAVRADGDATEVKLVNNVPAFRADGTVVEQLFTLAQYTVEGSVPARPPYVAPTVTLPSTTPDGAIERTLRLSGSPADGGVQFTINGRTGIGHSGLAPDGGLHEPDEQFRQGVPVRFTISANVSPEHPFHLHGQFFQVVERDGVVVEDEPGFKDTVLVRGRGTVTVLTYFENPGRWMYHCHIGEHGDLGMMGEWEVLAR